MASPLAVGVAPAQADNDLQCDGVFTGGSYDRVVVPRNGACTLLGTEVREGVVARRSSYFQSTGSSIRGNIKGEDAQTLFVDSGTKVGGDVSGKMTRQVFIFNSAIEGNVIVRGARQEVQICGTEVARGDIHVRNSRDEILIGDSGNADCLGNRIARGNVVVEKNKVTDYLFVRGNTIAKGDIRVLNNTGPAEKRVEDNSGGDDLKCSRNRDPFIAGGNTGWDQLTGQCRR